MAATVQAECPACGHAFALDLPRRIGGSNQSIGMRDLAEYIGRPLRTVEKRHREWQIPGEKIHGRWSFIVRDVDAWIEAEWRRIEDKRCSAA